LVGGLLWLAVASGLRAQLTTSVAVARIVLLSASQANFDGGTLFANGTYVSDGFPTPVPTAVFGLSATDLNTLNGKYLVPTAIWPLVSPANFTRSTQIYNVLGIPHYTITAGGSGGGGPANTAPAFTTSPQSQTVTAGAGTQFAATATGTPSPTLQWQLSSNGGGTWSSITNSTTYGGATTTTLTITGASAAISGNRYRCVATNSVASVASGSALLTVTTPTAARPANDNMAAAAPIPAEGGVFSADSTGATREAQEPARHAGNAGGRSVWWVWTAPANVRATVSTIGSNFDTLLAVYTRSLALVAENDDLFEDFLRSEVSFNATAGRDYLIAVDGYNGAGGAVALNLGFLPVTNGPSTGTARLINLATRAQVGTGGDILIPGIVVGGTTPKTLLIRASGPALAQFGLSGTLANPTLNVFRGSTLIASNDDWGAGPGAGLVATLSTAAGAFAFAPGGRDSALAVTLAPGSYTAQVSGVGGTTGMALVEVYDTDGAAAGGRLTNLSTRAQVGTGANILIPGLVIAGTGARRLLIRAVGPTLRQFSVTGTLRDPRLVIYQGATPIAANDDWVLNESSTAITDAARATGAFTLPVDLDAAVVVTLPAGAYTVQVSGVGGATGVALVEVYEVP
jgi:Immunoglobulin I-set domain